MRTSEIFGHHPVAALDWTNTKMRPPTTLERRRGPDQQEASTPMAVGNPTYHGPVSIPGAGPRNDRG